MKSHLAQLLSDSFQVLAFYFCINLSLQPGVMVKLYALAFSILPFFCHSQQMASNKALAAGFSSTTVHSSPAADSRISADEIASNIGRLVTFCGKVYSAKQQKDELGPHSVFYVAGKYVNEFVDVKIRLKEGYSFPASLYSTLNLKNVCITGTVLNEGGSAAIYLDSVKMFNLEEEAEHTPRQINGVMPDQELKVLSNAYLLTGPRWKEPVITFLKIGSIIIAEQVRGNWAFVRVIERNGENVALEDIAGYINTKALGLGSDGKILIPH